MIYKIIQPKDNILARYKLINTTNGTIEIGTFNTSQLQVIKGILNAPEISKENFTNKEVKDLNRIKQPINKKRK